MKMKTLYAAVAGALLLGTATLAPAQKAASEPARAVTPSSMENKTAGISSDEYKREKDRIEADAKQAKAACKGMKDNAKDICEAESKAKEKVAKKELDYKKNPNAKNAQDVARIKAEAAYEVAKEKCEDQKGAEATACKKQAKETKDLAVKEAKGKKMADAGSTTATTNTATTTKSTTSSNAPSSSSMGTSSGVKGTSGASSNSAGTTGATSKAQTKSGQ